MTDDDKINRGGEWLDAELDALRAGLRALPARPGEQRLLRTAHARAAARGSMRNRRVRPLLAPFGVAAVLALVALAALLAVLTPRGPPVAAASRSVLSAARTARDAGTPFHPLLYGPAWSPVRAYSIVRVRIPLAALAASIGAPLEGSIDADVLIGEDGLATAIRFNAADTVLVAASAR